MYRKFRADYLFTGHALLPGDWVLITDPQGTVVDIVRSEAAGDDIVYYTGLLTPGFINAHCHLELSHLKGLIPEHTGLVPFVQQVMAKRYASEEIIQQAMQDACDEMWKGGIVAVGDICNTIDSIPAKQNSPISWHNFIEITGFVDAVADKRFADAKRVAEAFGQMEVTSEESSVGSYQSGVIGQPPTVNDQPQTANRQPSTANGQPPTAISLSPHAPYSVSATLFDLINNETAGQLLSIHNQETADENKFFEKKEGSFLKLYEQLGIDISHFAATGKTSLQSYWPRFNQGQSVILVHNSFTSREDIDFMLQPFRDGNYQPAVGSLESTANGQPSTVNSQPYPVFCLCPNANRYIENLLPPVELLRKNNQLIVLGTDSYASNWQLSILEEMKTLQQVTALPLAELLKWATLNGAMALRVSNRLGSFDKDKTPGIVWVDQLDGLRFTTASVARRLL